jgi:hypothetical protein
MHYDLGNAAVGDGAASAFALHVSSVMEEQEFIVIGDGVEAICRARNAVNHPHPIGAWLIFPIIEDDFKRNHLVLLERWRVQQIAGVHKHVVAAVIRLNEPETPSLNVKHNSSDRHFSKSLSIFRQNRPDVRKQPGRSVAWRGLS